MASYPGNPRVLEAADFASLHQISVAPGPDGAEYATLVLRLMDGGKSYADGPQPAALHLTDGMNPRLLTIEPMPEPAPAAVAEPEPEPEPEAAAAAAAPASTTENAASAAAAPAPEAPAEEPAAPAELTFEASEPDAPLFITPPEERYQAEAEAPAPEPAAAPEPEPAPETAPEPEQA